MTRRDERLALVLQWFGKNPNIAKYFIVKIPNLFKEIERAIIVEDSLYGNFIGYATRFLPRVYVTHIIEGKLRRWLCANGSY